MQPSRIWSIKDDHRLALSRPVIMGVVNCTPDSFYDGGRHAKPETALQHALLLAAQGAAILDVGGESTRPGSLPVCAEEELARVLPVIRELRTELTAQGVSRASAVHVSHSTPRSRDPAPVDRVARPEHEGAGQPAPDAVAKVVSKAVFGPESGYADGGVVISIDTSKAVVAAAGLEAGAAIVNDVSACRSDPELVDVLRQYQPGYVLMHAQGKPETMQVAPVYANVVDEVCRFFDERMHHLVRSGLAESSIVLDPGIGFGKRLEHNLELLRNVDRLARMGRPILVGISHKSFWKGLLGLELEDRGMVTQVATALLATKGAAIHRVHDVAASAQTLRVVEALAGPEVSGC
ncbi:MAG: dihydropteroate synthase [Desulfovibrionales bacterium]|nr:MAG: dihydropteroate synthase [Desulfovibrionales bacterium]